MSAFLCDAAKITYQRMHLFYVMQSVHYIRKSLPSNPRKSATNPLSCANRIVESIIPDENNFVIELEIGTEFYNAKDTTGDTVRYNGKVYYNFIEFWEASTGKELRDIGLHCMNRFCENSKEKCDNLEGAHAVLDKPKGSIKKGERCYIVPLCRSCNNHTNESKMKLSKSIPSPEIEWGDSIKNRSVEK